ncbi:hypothetical protein Psp6_00007 [Pseudomonas phage Psp6]|nr:hypothetical protein Psp6_00007 [Pseudomonas phage Psp6]
MNEDMFLRLSMTAFCFVLAGMMCLSHMQDKRLAKAIVTAGGALAVLSVLGLIWTVKIIL